MPLQPLLGPGPLVGAIAERQYHVWEAAGHLVMLGIGYPAEVLGLVAPPAGDIWLDPLPSLLLLCG